MIRIWPYTGTVCRPTPPAPRGVSWRSKKWIGRMVKISLSTNHCCGSGSAWIYSTLTLTGLIRIQMGKNDPKKEKVKKFIVLKLDVLFWGLEASSVAWTSSGRPRYKYFWKKVRFFRIRFDLKCWIRIRIETVTDPQHWQSFCSQLSGLFCFIIVMPSVSQGPRGEGCATPWSLCHLWGM